MSAHKPELDNMTPSQIRVLCEELLYTMDCDQRTKIATKLPGIYKMIYGSIPATMVEWTANQIAFEMNEQVSDPAVQKISNERMYRALQKIGL